MKQYKLALLATLGTMAFGVCVAPVTAAEVLESQLDNSSRLQYYQEFEYQDEQCQNYRPVPAGYYREGCYLYPIMDIEPAAGPEMATYSVHFGFDEAMISPSAAEKLDLIANEIKRTNPGVVTISGYTDTAGPQDYNNKLSQERVRNVVQAFNNRGIPTRVVQPKAFGESYLAVPTGDGVPEAANRRATISFMK